MSGTSLRDLPTWQRRQLEIRRRRRRGGVLDIRDAVRLCRARRSS